jgi:hypothetical protein
MSCQGFFLNNLSSDRIKLHRQYRRYASTSVQLFPHFHKCIFRMSFREIIFVQIILHALKECVNQRKFNVIFVRSYPKPMQNRVKADLFFDSAESLVSISNNRIGIIA